MVNSPDGPEGCACIPGPGHSIKVRAAEEYRQFTWPFLPLEWYWDPYWLYSYWKSHLIITGLTVMLVLACVGVSILVIKRRIAKSVHGRRQPPHP